MHTLQILAQISLVLTLAVVAVYTWETHLLRRLQVRPALIVIADLSNNVLFIRNVGSSAALNVEIPDFKGIQLMISADPNWLDYIEADQSLQINLRSQANQWVGLTYTAVLAGGPLRILVRYQDIDAHAYETKTEVTLRGTKVLYSHRVTFWSRWSRLAHL